MRRNIAAINRAIAGLPAERIRMHVCWGNYEGPHHLDVPLEDVLPLYYEANVGALLLPFANPRHQHEWRALQKYPPPHNWLIIAGVIDTTTNYIEHPQVVADRIECVAMAIGDPRRVLAGTDCGFGTAAGFGECAPGVVWEDVARPPVLGGHRDAALWLVHLLAAGDVDRLAGHVVRVV